MRSFVPFLFLVSSTLSPNSVVTAAFTPLTRIVSSFSRMTRSMTLTGAAVDVDNATARDSSTITKVQQHIAGPPLPPIPATAKRLFLIRHGEVINPGGDRPVYYGAMDVPLSPLGQEEAMAAATYLQQHSLQHVACSPLSRAVFGANQVLALQQQNDFDNGSDLVVLVGFTELDRGAWCGKTKTEIGPDNMARFDACDESVTPVGGESFPTLKRRVLHARNELLHMTSPGHASALVSHLQVTRSLLSDALGVPTNKMVELSVATASVTCIDYDMDSDTGSMTQTVHFQSFKPEVGLEQPTDGAN